MTSSKQNINIRTYRLYAAVASIITLGLALWSKYYSGPYHTFADAWLGDVFIVICLYFWLALAFPRFTILIKFLAIALLATGVELLQLSGWPASLNVPEPFVFILGTSFDPKDFLCYAIGLTLAAVLDMWFLKLSSST